MNNSYIYDYQIISINKQHIEFSIYKNKCQFDIHIAYE